ncbi:MAG: hypothetical protein QXU98_09160 [Candidatus Parvarchaeota archaeon]
MEYRIKGNLIRLAAILETKKYYVTDSKYVEDSANFKAIKMLAEKANIPFYHVWYYKDNYEDENEPIKKFLVWDTSKPKSSAESKTPKQMEEFIKDL